jgi:hypothetical protein
MTKLTEKEISVLKQCFIRSKGEAWEPPSGTNTNFFDKCVTTGYLKVVDGRCGFELLKNAMVAWTEAGKIAIQSLIEKDRPDEKSH